MPQPLDYATPTTRRPARNIDRTILFLSIMQTAYWGLCALMAQGRPAPGTLRFSLISLAWFGAQNPRLAGAVGLAASVIALRGARGPASIRAGRYRIYFIAIFLLTCCIFFCSLFLLRAISNYISQGDVAQTLVWVLMFHPALLVLLARMMSPGVRFEGGLRDPPNSEE